jgi:predicted alpha/beta-fold hydrolase
MQNQLAYVGKPYTVPSLLIKAEEDPVLTPAYVRGVPYDLFVDLEQSTVTVGGHNVQTEAADEVNQELTRYLTKLFDEKLKMPRTKNKIQQVQEDKATVAHEE